jgi:threonine dehydrogenase-like Zn-dependent dehydrogenase
VHRYLHTLMKLIEEGKVDPTVIISHRSRQLSDGPDLYNTFRKKEDGCVKVVFFPHGQAAQAERSKDQSLPPL